MRLCNENDDSRLMYVTEREKKERELARARARASMKGHARTSARGRHGWRGSKTNTHRERVEVRKDSKLDAPVGVLFNIKPYEGAHVTLQRNEDAQHRVPYDHAAGKIGRLLHAGSSKKNTHTGAA